MLFQHFLVFSSPVGVISTPKSVENGVKLTPLEIGPVLTPAGVNLTPEFLQCDDDDDDSGGDSNESGVDDAWC